LHPFQVELGCLHDLGQIAQWDQAGRCVPQHSVHTRMKEVLLGPERTDAIAAKRERRRGGEQLALVDALGEWSLREGAAGCATFTSCTPGRRG
jgi:hypothetical protein